MGLFTRDYSKPGKGVSKDEPKKNAFFHFFELYARKFFQLVGYNLFYFVCMLPLIIAFYNVFYSWLYSLADLSAGETVSLPVLVDLLRLVYNFVPEVLHIPLVVVSLAFYGPLTMGYTYCLRNFAREEHAWMTDFFSRAISNFKQGLFFGLLDALMLIILYFNWNYSALIGEETISVLAMIIRCVTVVIFVYYLFMRNYFYQLAVTVNLNVRQIIKDAAIFGVLGLWRNILAVVLAIAVCFVSLMLHPLVELILVPFITFSLAGYISVYTTYPVVDKYIVKPAKEAEAKERGEERIGFDDLPPAVLPPELGGPGAGAHLDLYDVLDRPRTDAPKAGGERSGDAEATAPESGEEVDTALDGEKIAQESSESEK